MKNVKSTLQKIRALAEGTNFEHEKNSALEKLNELMKKHGVAEGDLDDEAVSLHDFEFNGEREEALLGQIVRMALNVSMVRGYLCVDEETGEKRPDMIGFYCTVSQKLEIDFLFNFYADLYRIEEKKLLEAFICKHRIFPKVKRKVESNPSSPTRTNEEKCKIMAMMHGMEDKTPQRRLPGGDC